jgi:transposase
LAPFDILSKMTGLLTTIFGVSLDMKRMIEFADKNNLEILLVYYPPYHSKYNPIERCWGILEKGLNS